jgi:iron complex outermembrane receptor protein
MTLWGSVARALRTPGRLDRDLTLIGYAPGFTPPLFAEIVGDPTFQPEVMIGWEAGYRQLLWHKLYVDIASFHNQYDNVESYGNLGLAFPTTPYPYELLIEPFANGLRGITDGIEIAPDWKPVSWFEVRGSYSRLHMQLHSKAGFSQESYASMDEGESPRREVSAQGIFMLPHGFEIVPDYRFVSALPYLQAPSYQTADVHVGYRLVRHLEIAADGRNLLQPHHPEFSATQICRRVTGGLRWGW